MGLTGCCAACPEAARLSATAVKQIATSWIFACRHHLGSDLQEGDFNAVRRQDQGQSRKRHKEYQSKSMNILCRSRCAGKVYLSGRRVRACVHGMHAGQLLCSLLELSHSSDH